MTTQDGWERYGCVLTRAMADEVERTALDEDAPAFIEEALG